MKCAAWVAMALASGCGASPIALDDLGSVALEARCARFARCKLFASSEACEAYFRRPPVSSYGPAQAAGKLAFDGESARQCQDALAAQSCDMTARNVRVVPEPCLKMFRGKIADGDPCSFDQECASSRCELPLCEEGVCCVGRCGASRPRGQVGDACERTSDCIDGFCGTDHTCHALGGVAATCFGDAQCDYGLACVQASPSLPGDCRAMPRIGEPCPYLRCADIQAVCDTTRHCVALGLPGSPCTAQGDCSRFAECDMTRQVCIELPTLGMPCDITCAGEAWCNHGTQPVGTCTEPQPNGTPCEEDDECASLNCKPGPVFDSCQDYPVCF